MRKAICAGLSALALLLSLPAYAQQPATSFGGQAWHPTAAQSAALTEANIAALKTALNLPPDQAKNWPAFEQAIRDLAKKHADRLSAWQQSERKPETHFDRVRQRAATLTKIAAGLNEYADAAAPLFQSLDQSQKQLFIVLTTKWVRP
jgi:LTXXQ motif family protein